MENLKESLDRLWPKVSIQHPKVTRNYYFSDNQHSQVPQEQEIRTVRRYQSNYNRSYLTQPQNHDTQRNHQQSIFRISSQSLKEKKYQRSQVQNFLFNQKSIQSLQPKKPLDCNNKFQKAMSALCKKGHMPINISLNDCLQKQNLRLKVCKKKQNKKQKLRVTQKQKKIYTLSVETIDLHNRLQ